MVARLALALWFVAVVAELRAVSGRTVVRAARDIRLVTPPPLTGLDTRVLNVVTAGWRGLYDDVVDIWELQMLVDKRAEEEGAPALYAALTAASRHHVKIESLYILSCYVLALDLHHPEYCERLTLDGMEALPNSWRIPVTEGYLATYKMSDPKKGALYYGLAGSRPGAPPYLADLSLKLARTNGLSPEDLQRTMDSLFGGAAGARAAEFLKERHK